MSIKKALVVGDDMNKTRKKEDEEMYVAEWFNA